MGPGPASSRLFAISLDSSSLHFISSAVAQTIFNMVDFGGNAHQALLALAPLWWRLSYGVLWPGSSVFPHRRAILSLLDLRVRLSLAESGLAGVNGAEWMKVVYGLVVSTCCGFGGGWLFISCFEALQECRSQRASKQMAHCAGVHRSRRGYHARCARWPGNSSRSVCSASCWLWVAWIPRT